MIKKLNKKSNPFKIPMYILALGIFMVTTKHNLLKETSDISIIEEKTYSENELKELVWQELQYFPVASAMNNNKAIVSYVDSFGAQRSYGGERVHEGCDIMAGINSPGLYPIISMTDGIVSNKGWLDKGGYRLGITSENGIYYYYAHLDSYGEFEIGDMVKAGNIIGYMGDTGYGEEGTRGQFATHLHLGIYLNVNNQEIAINPYPYLSYIENTKIELNF